MKVSIFLLNRMIKTANKLFKEIRKEEYDAPHTFMLICLMQAMAASEFDVPDIEVLETIEGVQALLKEIERARHGRPLS